MPYSYTANTQTTIRVQIRSRGDSILSGGNMRRMAHKVYWECVSTGRNDVSGNSERFYNYRVYDPGYEIICGSGIPQKRWYVSRSAGPSLRAGAHFTSTVSRFRGATAEGEDGVDPITLGLALRGLMLYAPSSPISRTATEDDRHAILLLNCWNVADIFCLRSGRSCKDSGSSHS
jgi:hypothetical protein